MNSLAAAHDAAVQMIDTSMVRVHQHAACIADGASSLKTNLDSVFNVTKQVYEGMMDRGWSSRAIARFS